jgi:hypothetical protein
MVYANDKMISPMVEGIPRLCFQLCIESSKVLVGSALSKFSQKRIVEGQTNTFVFLSIYIFLIESCVTRSANPQKQCSGDAAGSTSICHQG